MPLVHWCRRRPASAGGGAERRGRLLLATVPAPPAAWPAFRPFMPRNSASMLGGPRAPIP